MMQDVVKIRVMANETLAEMSADVIARALVKEGYVFVEQTPPYPCRPPMEHLSRVYLTMLKKMDGVE